MGLIWLGRIPKLFVDFLFNGRVSVWGPKPERRKYVKQMGQKLKSALFIFGALILVNLALSFRRSDPARFTLFFHLSLWCYSFLPIVILLILISFHSSDLKQACAVFLLVNNKNGSVCGIFFLTTRRQACAVAVRLGLLTANSKLVWCLPFANVNFLKSISNDPNYT